MKSIRQIALVIPLIFLSTGCLSRQVSRDGQNYRQAILAMYEDQVLDNLVRAYENEPFVQLTYRDLYVQDEDTFTGSVQDVYLDQRVRTKGPMLGLVSLVKTFSNTWTFGATAKRDRTMSFKADPVTDKNDVYEAYLQFAHSEAFLVSDEKPECPVHRIRHCRGKYYWIPKDAAEAFLDLVLKTTFMRGPQPTTPAFYERTIDDVLVKEIKGQEEKQIMFKFDKPVKNGVGYLEVDHAGEVQTFRLFPVKLKSDEFPDVPVVQEGRDTLYLRSSWSPSLHTIKPEKLRGKTARVFLPDYPPPPQKPLPDVQKIIDDLTAIRANLPRVGNP